MILYTCKNEILVDVKPDIVSFWYTCSCIFEYIAKYIFDLIYAVYSLQNNFCEKKEKHKYI
jgi:hypothetical protein